MNELRVVIVDDEPAARARIRRLLASHDHVRVVSECRNGNEAVAAIEAGTADVVFLDIQMPGLDGFGVLSRVRCSSLPFVIFVTAYDRYALEAFEVNAVDYLLKPFSDERFHETMSRVVERVRQRDSSEFRGRVAALLKSVDVAETPPPRTNGNVDAGRCIVVRDGSQTHEVRERDVVWIASSGNYVEIHLADRELLSRETLSSLEQSVTSDRFVRIHRRWLVNVEYIENIRYVADGRFRVELAGGRALTSSRSFRTRVEELHAARGHEPPIGPV